MKKLVLATFLFTGLLPAQKPNARGLTPLKDALGLTDAQVQQLREMRRQEFQAARPTHQQMREKAGALREAMKANPPDSAKIGQLMVELKDLRESIRSSRATVGDKASGILTPEQRTRLAALQDALRLAPAARQAAALGLITPPERERAASGQRALRARRMAPARW